MGAQGESSEMGMDIDCKVEGVEALVSPDTAEGAERFLHFLSEVAAQDAQSRNSFNGSEDTFSSSAENMLSAAASEDSERENRRRSFCEISREQDFAPKRSRSGGSLKSRSFENNVRWQEAQEGGNTPVKRNTCHCCGSEGHNMNGCGKSHRCLVDRCNSHEKAAPVLRCEYCGATKTSTAKSKEDGRHRIRCECRGLDAKGRPKQHACWTVISQQEAFDANFGGADPMNIPMRRNTR